MIPFIIAERDIPVELLEVADIVNVLFADLPADLGEDGDPVSCHLVAKIIARLGRVEDCVRVGLYYGSVEHSWLEFKFVRDYDIVLDVYSVSRYPPVNIVLLRNYGDSRNQYMPNGAISIASTIRDSPVPGHQMFGTSIFTVDVRPKVSTALVKRGIDHLTGVRLAEVKRLRELLAISRKRFYVPPMK